MRLLYWVLFVSLLLAPMVASFVFISSIFSFVSRFFEYYKVGKAGVLLKDILFVEGILLFVLGAQSGEYIWNWIRGNRDNPTELKVGLTLLAFGCIYLLVALFLPAGIVS